MAPKLYGIVLWVLIAVLFTIGIVRFMQACSDCGQVHCQEVKR